MAKAVFRVSGIKTTGDLGGIGKHNLDRISATNEDIDRSRSDENITLVNCPGSYGQMFDFVTEDLRRQHEEQMKTARKDRQKSFREKINSDRSDVACEFLMSASPDYFEGKSPEEIEEWGKASLDFVSKKIGIEEKNILHAVVHMDEKTPHLHVVAVPLVKKYDGRRKEEVLAISRRHFIKTREDMAKVQTDYVDFMNERGFDLERGMEKSGAKHLEVARYKVKATSEELDQVTAELQKANAAKAQVEEQIRLLEKRAAELKERAETVDKAFSQRLKLKTNLKDITSRTEPVRRLLGGKNKEEEVKLPKKDYKRLLALAKRGAGAEKVIAELERENGRLRGENDKLEGKNKSLSLKNAELAQGVGRAKLVITELQIRNGSLEHENERQSQFLKSAGLEQKFDEWNQKMDRQQTLERNRRDFGMER